MGDWLIENTDIDSELFKALNLLNVAAAGNSLFLDKLLQANLDPNLCDSKRRTPLVRPPTLIYSRDLYSFIIIVIIHLFCAYFKAFLRLY